MDARTPHAKGGDGMTTPTSREKTMSQQHWGWFYAASEDAETYHAADSRDDAIARGVAQYDGERFYICEGCRMTLRSDFIRTDDLLEQFEEYNEDAWGEHGPDCHASPAALAELGSELRKTFEAWMEKHRPYIPWTLAEFRNGETITPTSLTDG